MMEEPLMLCYCVIFLACIVVKAHMEVESHSWIIESSMSIDELSKTLADTGIYNISQVVPGFYALTYDVQRQRRKSQRETFPQKLKALGVRSVYQERYQTRVRRDFVVEDSEWEEMWYIHTAAPNMGILESWTAGNAGQDVAIAIVDDGVEVTQRDLSPNYDPDLSYDFVNSDSNPNPSPGNDHGTRCAGIAVAAKNDFCGLGVAYSATLAGLRVLGGFGTLDSREARALQHLNNRISVYSNSWGVPDGHGFEGPGPLTMSALRTGTVQGRGGLGSIFVWAAGNGGFNDNCNCDGYANSVYTIAVSSVDPRRRPAAYAEMCDSVLAATYSGYQGAGQKITTTDIGGGCTSGFTGTSASSPMAAGIIALALEANPLLTWRDVQYLVVETSDTSGLEHADVITNGAGKAVSHYLGFGLMNATKMTDTARNWTYVPDQHNCSTNRLMVERDVHPTERTVFSSQESNGCNSSTESVQFIEYVQVRAAFSATNRGNVQLYLDSPAGTTSQLLSVRPGDSGGHLRFWSFTSVFFWGENPQGNWTLRMQIDIWQETGTLHWWEVSILGTETDPALGRPDVTSTLSLTRTAPNTISTFASAPENIIRVSNRLDPDEAPSYSAPHLDPNCLQSIENVGRNDVYNSERTGIDVLIRNLTSGSVPTTTSDLPDVETYSEDLTPIIIASSVGGGVVLVATAAIGYRYAKQSKNAKKINVTKSDGNMGQGQIV